jgi:hypothetical protein
VVLELVSAGRWALKYLQPTSVGLCSTDWRRL